MSYTGPETGGVLIDGLKPVQWALQVFLPPLIPSILGQAVAIFVCYWEVSRSLA
jgi:ABC-type glycerol-3-phosphate transport system permease component